MIGPSVLPATPPLVQATAASPPGGDAFRDALLGSTALPPTPPVRAPEPALRIPEGNGGMGDAVLRGLERFGDGMRTFSREVHTAAAPGPAEPGGPRPGPQAAQEAVANRYRETFEKSMRDQARLYDHVIAFGLAESIAGSGKQGVRTVLTQSG